MYETFFDKLQTYFGQENLHLLYLDFDSFVLSISNQKIFNDIKNHKDLIDFSILDVNYKRFSIKNKKVFGKFKKETPKNFWVEEFLASRSENCAFEGGDDSKNKYKGIWKSRSKNIKFEACKKGLDGKT